MENSKSFGFPDYNAIGSLKVHLLGIPTPVQENVSTINKEELKFAGQNLRVKKFTHNGFNLSMFPYSSFYSSSFLFCL